MPIDQYKMTIEAKPLQLLYSKYAAQGAIAANVVRPLGIVRKVKHTSSVASESETSTVELAGEGEGRAEEVLTMPKDLQDADENENDNQKAYHISVSEHTRLQSPYRTKSQVFGQKYKLAASRAHGDLKAPNIYSKRVIQLPMLKINLETYVGDRVDSKALEATRKSLKKIIDVGRKTVKPAGIINYQFKTPGQGLKDTKSQSSAGSISPSFGPQVKRSNVNDQQTTSEYAGTISESDKTEFKNGFVEGEPSVIVYSLAKSDSLIVENDNEDDLDEMTDTDNDSTPITANRLSSAATLGTTYRNIDQSPQAEGMVLEAERSSSELSTAKRKHSGKENRIASQTPEIPTWPSFEDVQGLMPDFSTFNHLHKPHNTRETRRLERGSSVHVRSPADNLIVRNGMAPKLRYTTHNSKTKLEPIIIPSYSNSECPMCNLFKHKETTPCPPNTPRTPRDSYQDIEMLEPLNEDVFCETEKESVVPPAESQTRPPDRPDRSSEDSTISAVKYTVSERRVNPADVYAQYRFGYIKAKTHR